MVQEMLDPTKFDYCETVSMQKMYEDAAKFLKRRQLTRTNNLTNEGRPLREILIARVERITRESKRPNELKKLATIAEAEIAKGISEFCWLGKKVITYKSSPEDDIIRGVDIIVEGNELEDGNNIRQPFFMGIDVTTSDYWVLKKMEKMNYKLQKKGKLTKVDFFKPSFRKQRSQRIGIPIFCIYIPANYLKDSIIKKGEFDQLNYKLFFLEQIIAQAKAQISLLQHNAAKSGNVQDLYIPHLQDIISMCSQEMEVTKNMMAGSDEEYNSTFEIAKKEFESALGKAYKQYSDEDKPEIENSINNDEKNTELTL